MFAKLRTAVYPPRMAPIGVKLWEKAFDTIWQFWFSEPKICFKDDFFEILQKKLEGRFAPEDGSDWRETLEKRVSDHFANLIFRASKLFLEMIFLEMKILKGCLSPEDGSDRHETLGKRVSDYFANLIFRAEKFFRGSIKKKQNFERPFTPQG